MAHNLNFNELTGKHSFVAVGEKAWHGLGQYVNEAMTAEQVIDLGGLNYDVAKKPIAVAGGQKIPNYFATVRTDTNDVLGVVSGAYHVVQNREAFTFFDSIIDSKEAIYQTAGALGKGERIFITAKLPSDILVHGEQVENYLLLTQGHDGKTGSAIQVGFTSIRVVCNNTLTAALRGIQNKVTILHFKNANAKLETAAKIMGMSSKYTQGLDQVFNRMAEVRITDKQLKEYIQLVLNPKSEQITEAEFSKQFVKTVDSVLEFAHSHDTQLTEAAKGTVWGAYNAISGYYGHVKSYKSQEEKMNDLYFKTAAGKIESAFELATRFIN
jgi:phage/plasmid-like protein (TIGR03299 family)